MMKIKTVLFFMFGLAGSVAFADDVTEQAASWSSVATLANQITLTEAPLDFGGFWQQLKNTKPSNQTAKLQQLTTSVAQLKPTDACQKWAKETLNHGIQAQQLFETLHRESRDSQQAYQGSLKALDDSGRWFQWLSLVWLGESIEAEALYAVGESEFAAAIKELRATSVQPSTAQTDSNPTQMIDANDDAAIQQAYHDIGKTMQKHFADYFVNDAGFDQLRVARSLQGDDFPAPGYYDPARQTMYYHPQEAVYDLAQVPWLYLHEGMPGHHYQNRMANAQLNCGHLGLNPQWLAYGRMALVEGWAAYVETLGVGLGVLETPASQRYVNHWQALRAMRVMVDVGMHHKGWSAEHASQFWLKHFPEGKAVMNREINRIQRWPMQVNSYVYGQYRIEQLKQQMMKAQGELFDLAQFHEQLLQLSGLTVRLITHFQSFQQEFFE